MSKIGIMSDPPWHIEWFDAERVHAGVLSEGGRQSVGKTLPVHVVHGKTMASKLLDGFHLPLITWGCCVRLKHYFPGLELTWILVLLGCVARDNVGIDLPGRFLAPFSEESEIVSLSIQV